MGKGDKKSKKGKISSGSYGVSRKRKKKTVFVAEIKKATPKKEKDPVEETKAPTKKVAAKKTTTKKAPVKKAAAKK